MQIEKLILKNLLKTEQYTRKVLPHLKAEYFLDQSDKLLFETIADFLDKYNTAPTIDALLCEVDTLKITDDQLKSIKASIEDITNDKTSTTYDWLVDATERFCKNKSAYNCIMQSIEILGGKSKLTEDAIPDLMKKALAVSFDPNVGHDYLNAFADRFEHYHRVEEKIPFDLDYFNRVTEGGVSKGTLNVILAGTGAGKSLAMGHFAAAAMSQGKKVLYITLELSEWELGRRIDANLMNVNLKDLMAWPKNVYDAKASQLKAKTTGQLIIKQYPTGSASVSNFRALIQELILKKNFKPDIIFIDYLNLCSSSRLKRATANSYEYIKAIAEEIRGLAVEVNVPIWTATQVTRSGYTSSDIGLEDTSESFGLPATADFMVAMMTNEQLEKLNQIIVKQLKNRYGDPTKNKRFVLGIDRGKMKLYDVADTEQNIVDANQQPANKKSQKVMNVTAPSPGTGYSPTKKFSGLKVT